MNDAQQAAFVQAQVVCALIELEAMKVQNAEKNAAYFKYNDFMELIDKYVIGYNAVIRTFQG